MIRNLIVCALFVSFSVLACAAYETNNTSSAEPELMPVKISSIPAGALILINNQSKGETDKTIYLYPGEYTVKLLKNGYAEAEQKIAISEKGGNIISMTLKKNSATLVLSLIPPDARVFINREEYTGKSEIDLSPGLYKIEVQKNGFDDQKTTVDLSAGGIVTKEIILLPKTGALQLTVTPENATVKVFRNGVMVYSWEGLNIKKGIPPGEYELLVTAPDYADLKKNILIEIEKTTIDDITLTNGATETVAAFRTGDFILVKGGTFTMGSDHGQYNEQPAHQVTLDDFYCGIYEVTQKQWSDVMGFCLAEFKGDNLPVENVSWDDVQEFIQKLTTREGKDVYRLPTEAEWEYAARGGGLSRGYEYSGSNTIDEVAWHKNNSNGKTHVIGTKKPNELGIYDMTGNVYEWCTDWYMGGYYAASPAKNPQGPESGRYRVLRGGSWNVWSGICTPTFRYDIPPGSKDNGYGFRLVKNP